MSTVPVEVLARLAQEDPQARKTVVSARQQILKGRLEQQRTSTQQAVDREIDARLAALGETSEIQKAMASLQSRAQQLAQQQASQQETPAAPNATAPSIDLQPGSEPRPSSRLGLDMLAEEVGTEVAGSGGKTQTALQPGQTSGGLPIQRTLTTTKANDRQVGGLGRALLFRSALRGDEDAIAGLRTGVIPGRSTQSISSQMPTSRDAEAAIASEVLRTFQSPGYDPSQRVGTLIKNWGTDVGKAGLAQGLATVNELRRERALTAINVSSTSGFQRLRPTDQQQLTAQLASGDYIGAGKTLASLDISVLQEREQLTLRKERAETLEAEKRLELMDSMVAASSISQQNPWMAAAQLLSPGSVMPRAETKLPGGTTIPASSNYLTVAQQRETRNQLFNRTGDNIGEVNRDVLFGNYADVRNQRLTMDGVLELVELPETETGEPGAFSLATKGDRPFRQVQMSDVLLNYRKLVGRNMPMTEGGLVDFEAREQQVAEASKWFQDNLHYNVEMANVGDQLIAQFSERDPSSDWWERNREPVHRARQIVQVLGLAEQKGEIVFDAIDRAAGLRSELAFGDEGSAVPPVQGAEPALPSPGASLGRRAGEAFRRGSQVGIDLPTIGRVLGQIPEAVMGVVEGVSGRELPPASEVIRGRGRAQGRVVQGAGVLAGEAGRAAVRAGDRAAEAVTEGAEAVKPVVEGSLEGSRRRVNRTTNRLRRQQQEANERDLERARRLRELLGL